MVVPTSTLMRGAISACLRFSSMLRERYCSGVSFSALELSFPRPAGMKVMDLKL